MKRIAITGNIAAGKSETAGLMEPEGVALCDSDALAHALLAPGSEAYAAVTERFGRGILAADGQVDRAALGRIVFEDPAALDALNGILHPGVVSAWEKWMAGFGPGKTVAVQVPQLFEAGLESGWDAVVCVCASDAVRRRRLEARGMEPHDIDRRMASQWPQGIKAEKADYVIWNDGDKAVLAAQVRRVLRSIREKKA